MSDENTNNVEIPVLEVFDRKSLDSLVQHIIDSGALGRSKIYTQLLRYLVDRTGDPTPPKEIEVAIEVLGRTSEFDVAKDSVVRVYIHQLRKKLDRYYRDHYPIKFGQEPAYRLVVPKGEYTIAATYFEPAASDVPLPQTNTQPTPLSYRQFRRSYRPWLIAATILLAANLLFMIAKDGLVKSNVSNLQVASQHSLWQAILNDNTPLLVVVGDYYIFGELDEAGNVKRMVREFNINSPLDLEDLFMTQPELAWKYYDLDLSYIPEGSAFALNSISPVLTFANKPINVKMMSELTTEDITTHHIIYLGYISGLDRLSDMVFAASGLRLGRNYDELVGKETGNTYTSNAGLPSFHEPFTDYSFFSFIQSAEKNYLMIVTGTRDAGLIHTAEMLTQVPQLNELQKALAQQANPNNSNSFEALYEVRGLNRKNFNAKLVYSSYIDAENIWKGNLVDSNTSLSNK